MDITELLSAVRRGDEDAKEQLFQHLLSELRSVARAEMTHERPGHTWVTSDLLQEALLRLHVDKIWLKAPNRLYVYAAGARAMFQLLVDHARHRAKDPDGPRRERIPLDEALTQFERSNGCTLLEFNDALEIFRTIEPTDAEVVVLRAGNLTYKQIGEYLQISEREVETRLSRARSWILHQVRRE